MILKLDPRRPVMVLMAAAATTFAMTSSADALGTPQDAAGVPQSAYTQYASVTPAGKSADDVLVVAPSPVASGHAGATPSRAAAPITRPVIAQTELGNTQSISIGEGKGTIVRLNEDATSVFVADPTIADIHVPSPRVILLLGKKAGTTTLYALGTGNKQLLQRTVLVQRDLDALQATMQARFPSMNIRITEGTGSLFVSGQAPNASEADAIVQSITPYLAEKEILVNHMTIDRPQQVQLRVRITEVDRNITQQWGINWQTMASGIGHFTTGIYSGNAIRNLTTPYTTGTGGTAYPVNIPAGGAFGLYGAFQTGNNSIEAMINALNQEGLLTILAEPNLVAESGQTASFLAGGEFPIPVSQINGAITVDFKQFGVKLDFTPTVEDEHHISLKVRPEVSQIDSTTTVTTNGITIPGLSVRRADTTVDLSSGQSFAIAGLLQTNTTDIVQQVPGIGSLPVLGKLFSSTNYLNNKTELVIIVTPYLVEPVSPAKLHTPLESLRSVLMPSNDAEYGFEEQQSRSNPDRADSTNDDSQPRLVGGAGYVY